nr:MAG TPA: hypothetical protein [Caudoviricetes sp.]
MRAKSRKKARSRDKNRRLRRPVLAGLFLPRRGVKLGKVCATMILE